MQRLLAASALALCLAGRAPQPPTPDLLPLPAKITVTEGYLKPDRATEAKWTIDPTVSPDNSEGYTLTIDRGGITAKAPTEAGLFYARQTLAQLTSEKGIPYVAIKDAPRFPYRGLHLDVSRNFYGKAYILKLLDAMAHYKMNRLHWHLTDGAGWRVQIDRYPDLTRKAAFRSAPSFVEWSEKGDHRFVDEGSEGAHGGYYTKDDIREVVAYAAERHITIVPEIEMPGHSSEVFVAYPHLTCSGEAYKGGDFCIGNEETFAFVEGVLTEIMEIFPSKYIHIGGDEAGKRAWVTCPACQARMRHNNLAGVDELQSYMIRRVEKFLNSHGRKLIGWDEILQGGIAPDATVMSWRNEMEGYKAARMHHDVVMTPQNYLYFDAYQADPATEPRAIGGYTPVRRVYEFDPAPADSLTREDAAYIIGVQANTWTEYIPTQQHLEYMQFPRSLAVAEIGWTPQARRDWQCFKRRMNAHIPVMQRMGFNVFTLSDAIEVDMEVDTHAREIRVTLDAEKHPVEIRYTTDGTTPTASSALYTSPIAVRDSAHIVAAIFRDGVLQGTPARKKVDYHRAIGKPVIYRSALYDGYMAGGPGALVDGYRGGKTYHDRRWQGYLNELDCTIDMERETVIRGVSARFMQLTGPQVWQPDSVELLTSTDGVNFTSRGRIATTTSPDEKRLTFEEYDFRGEWQARYVRLMAENSRTGRAFIFADEIVVW